MNLPRITIVIANYNYGQHVSDAIDSALNQDYKGLINICIVDDGSSDNSWDVIKSKLKNPKELISTSPPKEFKEPVLTDRRENRVIFAIRTDNNGASIARNIAIEYCLEFTDAYCILDADDEYYPPKVSSLVLKWLHNPREIGVVYADYDIINTSTGRILPEFKQPYNREILSQECIVHSNALISKEAFLTTREENGEFYDSALHGPASGDFIGSSEDYDLWIRISEKFSMIHIPTSLGIAKITGNNQSSKVTPSVFGSNAQHIKEKSEKRRDGK